MQTYTIKEKCSRCPRVMDEREATVDEVLEASEAQYAATYTVAVHGTTKHSYGDLCETCDEHVRKSLEDLFSPIETVSAKRTRKGKGKKDAEEPAPDGSAFDIDLEG